MKRNLSKFNALVEAFESLPTIGKKSALRLAYYIVYQNTFVGMKIVHTIESALHHTQMCRRCGFLSEHELCHICSDDSRDNNRLCIVQDAKDVFAIEESRQYNGNYFVLGDELDEGRIKALIVMVADGITDVLFGLTPSVANDGLILYIEEKLKEYDIEFSKIAQGVPTGVTLENVDILSLAKAIESKVKI
jgi:recombination protein RecR